MTLEEKIEKIKDLRPIDDVFFEVLALNKKVVSEILSTIMEDPKLEVLEVIVQSDVKNLYGRSVRLDALCTLADGKKVNIEVQRSRNDDHFRRARFNASSITIKESETGTDFKDIPELYIVYISEFDFIGEGRTTYHIEKMIKETGTVIDDGEHEIFVNTIINDGSPIADLMSCFTMKTVCNPNFPELSNEVIKLKTTERGLDSMCDVMKKYEDIAWKKGLAEGEAKGKAEGRAEGKAEGRAEGKAEGRAEGMAEGREAIRQKMILLGMPAEQINAVLGQ